MMRLCIQQACWVGDRVSASTARTHRPKCLDRQRSFKQPLSGHLSHYGAARTADTNKLSDRLEDSMADGKDVLAEDNGRNRSSITPN